MKQSFFAGFAFSLLLGLQACASTPAPVAPVHSALKRPAFAMPKVGAAPAQGIESGDFEFQYAPTGEKENSIAQQGAPVQNSMRPVLASAHAD